MKKKLISWAMVLAMCLTLLPETVLATSLPLSDDNYWESLSNSEAIDLLTQVSNKNCGEDVIFIYYRDTCGYSKAYVPQFYDFAAANNLHLYGYEYNSEGYLISLRYLEYMPDDSTISTFPYVVVYNAATKEYLAAKSVHSLSAFTDMLSSVGLYSGSSDDNSSSGSSGSSSGNLTNDSSISSEEWEVLRLVNQHRMSIGVQPLTTNDAMQKAGNQRAYELTIQYDSDHLRPDGSKCYTVLDDYNISSYNMAAENIAKGQRSASEVVTAWLNSPGHRANIEHSSLTHIGIGADSYCWAQDFIGANCSYSSISLSKSSISAVSGQDLEDILEKANITVTAQCSKHGRCSLPLIAAMCTGYSTAASGTQEVTVQLGSATAKLSITGVLCTEHTFDAGQVTKEATCTSEGTMTYTCTVCGYQRTQSIAKTDHTYDSGQITKKATCTSEGTMTYTCTVCGYQRTQSIAKTDHILNSQGVCTVCGQQIKDTTNNAPDNTTNNVPDNATNNIPDNTTNNIPDNMSYTVWFDTNGGAVSTASKDVTNGGTYGTLPVPTRNRYEFDGWYTSAIGGTQITSDSTVSLTGNQTLYAHWNYTGKDISGLWAPTVAKFSDVPLDSVFCGSVAWAVDRGITKGYNDGTFKPSTLCTHNHILTFLWRSQGSPESIGDNDFAKAINWAKAKGVADSSVNGSAYCTRADAVMYLWRLAGSPSVSDGVSFSDVPSNAAYATAVAWAVANDITTGYYDGTFGPNNTCTRGHITAFLCRAYS